MAIRGRALILLVAFAGAAFAADPALLSLIGSDKPDACTHQNREQAGPAPNAVERRFVELVTALQGLQAMSDADCQLKLVGLDAFEAFQSADPKLEPPRHPTHTRRRKGAGSGEAAPVPRSARGARSGGRAASLEGAGAHHARVRTEPRRRGKEGGEARHGSRPFDPAIPK